MIEKKRQRVWPGMVLILLAVLSMALIVSRLVSGATFDTNILSLMPRSEHASLNALANQQAEQLAERRIVLLLKSTQADILELSFKALKSELQAKGLVQFSADDSLPQRLTELYKPYRYQLLSEPLRSKLKSSSAEEIAADQQAHLYGLVGTVKPYRFGEDPYNLGGRWLASFGEAGNNKLSGEDGGEYWLALTGVLSSSPLDPSIQAKLAEVLAPLQASEVQVFRSGFVFHAMEGASIARKEISTLGLASVSAIIFLVLFAFRSISALLAIFLVLTLSSAVALATCLLVYERINLITLAFGTSLLGIAVDYCFHYLCVRRTVGNGQRAALAIRAGVLLSMLSSCAAYLLQYASPFPGLHQFATFVISGLLMAGLSVLYVLPLCKLNIRESSGKRVAIFFQKCVVPSYSFLTRKPLFVVVVLAMLALLSVLFLWQNGSNDDVRNLNTSGEALMESEAEIGRLLSRSGAQQYFVIPGGSQERLIAAEKLSDFLEQQSAVTVYGLANFVPSLQRQREDYELIQSKIFGPEGAHAIVCDSLPGFCGSVLPVPAFSTGLKPESLPEGIRAQLGLGQLRSLKIDLLFPSSALSPVVAKTVQANSSNDVHYIDRAVHVSGILESLREQVGWLIGGFMLTLLLLSWWVFAASGLVLVGPLLVAVLLALAAAGSVNAGVSLFHLLAVLLVIGLSVDASIFYLRLGFTAEVWEAVTLSSLTTMLAFGLLSYSRVPVLEHFGTVVSVGLFSAWLLIPLVYLLQRERSQNDAY